MREARARSRVLDAAGDACHRQLVGHVRRAHHERHVQALHRHARTAQEPGQARTHTAHAHGVFDEAPVLADGGHIAQHHGQGDGHLARHAHARQGAHELVDVRGGHDDRRQKPAGKHLAQEQEERRQHGFEHAGVQLGHREHARHRRRVQREHAERKARPPRRDAEGDDEQHHERLEPQPRGEEHRERPQKQQGEPGPRVGPEGAAGAARAQRGRGGVARRLSGKAAILAQRLARNAPFRAAPRLVRSAARLCGTTAHAVTPAFSNCFFKSLRPTSPLARAHASVSATMAGSTQSAPVASIVSM